MKLHYDKHHKTYTDNLNKLLASADSVLDGGDFDKIEDFAGKLNFNGGGFKNHNFFFENLAPAKAGGGVAPK